MENVNWSNKKRITTGDILEDFLKQHYPAHLTKYKIKGERLSKLSYILNLTITENNKLNSQVELPDEEFSKFFVSQSLSQKDLKKNLGYKYREILIELYDISNSYNKMKNLTKAFKLKDSVRKKLLDYFIDTMNTPQDWYNENGRKLNQIKDGIIRITELRQRAKSKVKIDGEIKVNTNLIKEVIILLIGILQNQHICATDKIKLSNYEITEMKLKIGGNEYYLHLVFLLYQIYRLTIRNGKFPQLYREVTNGRLYGFGFNLQSMIKRARILSFMKQGEYDFDISTAHPVIFKALANRLKFKTPTINYYINHKKQTRELLADEINDSVDKIKEGLNSLFYGSKLVISRNKNKPTSLQEIFGNRTMKFINHNYIKSLYCEITELSKLIIKDSTLTKIVRGKTILNVMDKSLQLFDTETGKRLVDRKILSHIITGYEVLIMQTTYEILNKRKCKVSLLIHDGFIGEDTDEKSLAREVKNKLNNVLPNLKLTFEKKKI